MGAVLPAAQQLADLFGVTRMTVRQALAEVRHAGYVTTDKGRGSSVAQPRIEQSLLNFYSFGRRFGSSGEEFTSTLIEGREVDADELRGKGITQGRCYLIVRLRKLGESPFILERAYIPTSLVPGILDRDLERQSLYDLLEGEYGQKPAGATEYLEPRVAEGEDAKLLEVADGFPVFYTERHTRNDSGAIIEVRMSLIRGDRIRFATELIPTQPTNNT